MTKKTHQAGGMLVSIIGFALLRDKGLLLDNVNDGLQWLVIYPYTMWGSTASDLDHHWDSCPSKDYASKVINTVLHPSKPLCKVLTKLHIIKKDGKVYDFINTINAKHRSWQTHSDLTLVLMLYLLYSVLNGKIPSLTDIDRAISSLVLGGISLGIIAHFILDILTPEGVWSILFKTINTILRHKILPEKISLVPRTQNRFFATGGNWESFIRWILIVSTYLALLWFSYILLEPYLPYKINIGIFQGGLK